LDRAAGGDRWLAAAVDLGGEMVDRLADPAGGFWVSEARPDLLVRSKEVFDGAVPAANGIAVLALLALAERTGEARWSELAAKALAAAGPLVEQFPDGARTMVLATRRWRAAVEAGRVAGGRGEEGIGGAGAASGAVAGGEPAGLGEEAERVVDLAVELDEPDGEGWRRLRLTMTVAPGWHVNAHQLTGEAAGTLIRTDVRIEGGELAGVEYPAGERGAVPGAGDALAVYSGANEIVGAVRLTGEVRTLVVRYQPCDDRRCLPAVERRLPLA
ncbi:MAG TPA: protein-disulfide reductase DsbD domain-containing protein, partial [Thermoanaerobaculia bacterium]